jgi:hypothetical protein
MRQSPPGKAKPRPGKPDTRSLSRKREAFRKEGLLLRAAMRPGKPWTHGQLWQSVLSEDSKHGSGEPDMLFFLTIESVTLA